MFVTLLKMHSKASHKALLPSSNLQYAEADRNIKFTLQGRSLKDMLELNKVHPEPAPQSLPTYSVPEERMPGDVNQELELEEDEPKSITTIESQLKEDERCARRWMIFSVAVGVFIVVAVTVPVVCLTVGCPPSNNTTSNNGTMDHLHVTILTTSTSSPQTTSNTIHPGSSHQPVSETSHPPTTSTFNAETSQQTQGNTTSSDTDPTTTTTQAKSCSDQNLFECNSTGVCISRELRCDGINDCVPDGEDEKNCPAVTCGTHQFTCLDGTCIPQSSRCDVDGKEDCADKSDEQGCNVTTSVP